MARDDPPQVALPEVAVVMPDVHASGHNLSAGHRPASTPGSGSSQQIRYGRSRSSFPVQAPRCSPGTLARTRRVTTFPAQSPARAGDRAGITDRQPAPIAEYARAGRSVVGRCGTAISVSYGAFPYPAASRRRLMRCWRPGCGPGLGTGICNACRPGSQAPRAMKAQPAASCTGCPAMSWRASRSAWGSTDGPGLAALSRW